MEMRIPSVAVITHGGLIMNLLAAMGLPERVNPRIFAPLPQRQKLSASFLAKRKIGAAYVPHLRTDDGDADLIGCGDYPWRADYEPAGRDGAA